MEGDVVQRIDAAPFSLYLDLEPGRKADLEVVSRAALALVSAVREVAYIIDPSIEIYAEIVSGTESSLSLNTIFKNKKFKDLLSTKNLLAVLATSLLWFGGHTRDWMLEKTLEYLTGHALSDGMSPEDIAKIAEAASNSVFKKIAGANFQQVYREIQNDPAIKGVGATSIPAAKPPYIVPRSEFAARAGTTAAPDVVLNKRIRKTREWVSLVSPVLLDSDRKWEFIGAEGKLSASIKDARFLHHVVSGETGLKLTSGIHFDVDLETFEEFEHGAWHVYNRNILSVHGWTPAPSQDSLTLLPSRQPASENGTRKDKKPD